MKIEIQALDSLDELADMRRAYLSTLTAPFDGMWEAFASMSHQRRILSAGDPAGFFCVDDEGQILQFFIAPPFEPGAREIFTRVAAREEVKGAMVSTADPLFLGLCLDVHETVESHTFLYQDLPAEHEPAREEALTLEIVEASELAAIAELQRDSLPLDPGDWLHGYLENLIARGELFAARAEGEVLATGELRVSDSQPPFADLGVITMRRHRQRGVASRVLRSLKQLSYERNLVPICSTTVDNVGAQRAIANAGFVSRHRISRFTF